MTPAEHLELLRAFHRDKLALCQRHVAAARRVSDYDFNNTYQYVIAREDVQLSWLRAAIDQIAGDMGLPPVAREEVPEPQLADAALPGILTDDRDLAQAFVDRWRPGVEAMTHARHRGLLRVILGETLEHRRFFDQALAGRHDVLGRRPDGAGTGGGVLADRWIE